MRHSCVDCVVRQVDRPHRHERLRRFLSRTLAAGAVVTLGACSSGSNPPPATSSARPQPTTARAVSAASPCTAAALGTRLVSGSYGTGFIAGTIEVWNPGNAPCRVDGAIRFTALLTDGSPDPNAQPGLSLRPLAVTLPAQMAPPVARGDPAAYLAAILGGYFRDDTQQSDGLCRQQDEITPATFVLSIGELTLRVPNQNAADPTGQDGLQLLHGCHGNVLLEQVSGPQH